MQRRTTHKPQRTVVIIILTAMLACFVAMMFTGFPEFVRYEANWQQRPDLSQVREELEDVYDRIEQTCVALERGGSKALMNAINLYQAAKIKYERDRRKFIDPYEELNLHDMTDLPWALPEGVTVFIMCGYDIHSPRYDGRGSVSA